MVLLDVVTIQIDSASVEHSWLVFALTVISGWGLRGLS